MQALINDVSEKMDKSVSALRNAFNKIRTGRANPSILDDIKENSDIFFDLEKFINIYKR